MPPPFNNCRRRGGKIRTVKPNAGTYLKVCIPPGKGKRKSVAGEVKHNKGSAGAKHKTRTRRR